MKQWNEDMIAGATAGAVGRLVTAPLDVIKIRFQLQSINKQKYISMIQTFRLIIKEEGVWSLWKGNIPATLLWVSYSMFQFAFYTPIHDSLKIPLDNYHPEKTENHNSAVESSSTRLTKGFSPAITGAWNTSVPFIAGAGSGMLATFITYPLDIMRTQFALQGKMRFHLTMLGYTKHTFETQGIKGFYAGMPAAVLGIAPFMGLNFFIYEHSMTTQTNLQEKYSMHAGGAVSMVISGVCGALAGGVSKLAMFPLDTIKKRLQAQVLLNTTMHHHQHHNQHSDQAGMEGPMRNSTHNITTKLSTSAASAKVSGSYISSPASQNLNSSGTTGTGSSVHAMKGSHHVGEYRGVVQCVSHIYRNEGLLGFYKGITPTLMKSVISTGITFAVFETTKKALHAMSTENTRLQY